MNLMNRICTWKRFGDRRCGEFPKFSESLWSLGGCHFTTTGRLVTVDSLNESAWPNSFISGFTDVPRPHYPTTKHRGSDGHVPKIAKIHLHHPNWVVIVINRNVEVSRRRAGNNRNRETTQFSTITSCFRHHFTIKSRVDVSLLQ